MRVFVLALATATIVPAMPHDFTLQTSRSTLQGSSVQSTPRVVHVDVIATDSRGRGVPNLRAEDFELREDGVPRPIDEARFITPRPAGADEIQHSVDSDASERVEAADIGARLIGIFLDDYHVGADNTERVRAAVARFIRQSLSPRDLIVVMRPLDSLFAIRLTRDRDLLLDAVGRFEGRHADYEPRNSYERSFMVGAPPRIEQLRAQVALSALNALASHLGNLNRDARKTLIVVSEGLPRVDRRRGLESLPTLETVTRSANRYNVSVYPVDPRRLAADARPTGEPEGLRSLAVSTNGQAIMTVADLGEAMEPIALDASAYYVLAYSTPSRPDGRFHDVEVSVKKAGVTVRSRKGYWAAPPDDAMRAALVGPRAPAPVEPPRRISPLITPWFGASRGSSGKTRVTFVWEPSPSVPGSRRPTAARVRLKVLASDDTALFDGPVAPTGPLRPDTSGDPGSRAVFEVAPGVVRLRMSIENEAEQAIDSDVRDVSIRDLSAPVVLGTPEIFRGRTARDFRAFESASNATPVAAREFSRTERLLIRVPAYAPAGDPLTVAAHLVNRKGQVIRDLDVRPPRPPAGAEIDLPLAGFAVGEYRIEISASSPTSQIRDALDFRVTN